MIGNITITNDHDAIEFERVCTFLQSSYWGSGRSPFAIRTSFENSICFSAVENDEQIGFARVVTDKAFHAFIFDVFVFPEQRGRGVSKMLMRAIMTHEDLINISGFMLGTTNAHDLYRQFGFENYTDQSRLMVRSR